MPITTLNLNDVNNLSSGNFIKVFGNLIDLHPAAAIGILKNKPFANALDISDAINKYLDGLHINDKQLILEQHPDLAVKFADLGKLTNESNEDSQNIEMNEHEKIELNRLNEEYKSRFCFPFVICTKETNLESIRKDIENRLCNQYEEEINIGIEEVKKIAKLRIFQIVIEK